MDLWTVQNKTYIKFQTYLSVLNCEKKNSSLFLSILLHIFINAGVNI